MYCIFLVSSQGREGIKVDMSFPAGQLTKGSMGRFIIKAWLPENQSHVA